MTTTRRDFLTTAVTAAGAAVTPHLAPPHEQSHDHDHDHQVVPSDPALRVKALESLLVEKGVVERAALDFAPAAPGLSSACRQSGTNRRRIARAPSSTRVVCCTSSDSHCLAEKHLSDPAAMLARKEAWTEAYRRTPHGKPVELENNTSS